MIRRARFEQVRAASDPGGVALSLGQQIRNHVLTRIDSGEWPEGSRIPSEAKLVEQLGASRMTIHIALRDLSAEGVLLRRQGAGTFVAPRRIQSTFLELRNIHAEIESRGNRHSTDVLCMEVLNCDMAVATEMSIAPGSPVFHSVLVHRENGSPIQVEDRYVNPQFSADYLEQDFTTITPNEHLMAAGPLEEVEHVVQAIPADESNSALLDMKAGDPVLLLRRRTWSRGMIASSARLAHPGARFSLAGRMSVKH
ncbi:MAG: histidine utilization repressor [Rhodobacter sp.]|nr:histidine utilization repressor [Rhodobacter sp.]